MDENEWTDLNDAAHQVWEQNADFWDQAFGEGNAFHLHLVQPSVERLLELQPGELILDAACGNGAFSRRLASQGARVVAFDQSEAFLERARAHSAEYQDRIEYRPIDATNLQQLLSLGERRFDAAISTMALMDMPAIEPLFQALARLLKPEGRLVFATMHPCFNSSYMQKCIEEDDQGGMINTRYTLKMTGYIRPTANRGVGIIGQPAPQLYFNRPLSQIFQACFRAGFRMDGFEEPVFPPEVEPKHPFSWVNFRDFPPVVTARFRLG